MNQISLQRKLRFKQVRTTARLFARLSTRPVIGKLLQTIGKSDLCSRALVGFSRPFPTFAAAQAYADRYGVPSHEHPRNTVSHLALNQHARPSDYPILFYLKSFSIEINSILDIGGSAGNLFYCYDQYLHFSPPFRWTVNEVPANNIAGRQLAQQRNEPRLHFIDSLTECPHADAVLISGALHYFEALPPALMQHLNPPPRHVFINRTPVIEGPTTITIQDAGTYYAISPARILSRSTLLESMSAANYDLIDEWTIPDFRFPIPLHPKSSANDYSGFYFKLKDA
jgi:putative methyltransferase (TIGR04325 family)